MACQTRPHLRPSHGFFASAELSEMGEGCEGSAGAGRYRSLSGGFPSMPQSPRGIEYCAELGRSRLDGSLPFPVSRHLGTVFAWHKPTSVLVVNLSHHLP